MSSFLVLRTIYTYLSTEAKGRGMGWEDIESSETT
jgi:hypothetical protein